MQQGKGHRFGFLHSVWQGEENKVKFSNQMAARLLSCSTGICSSKVFIFEMLQVASGGDGPYF